VGEAGCRWASRTQRATSQRVEGVGMLAALSLDKLL
jgi:hypothetical protein